MVASGWTVTELQSGRSASWKRVKTECRGKWDTGQVVFLELAGRANYYQNKRRGPASNGPDKKHPDDGNEDDNEFHPRYRRLPSWLSTFHFPFAFLHLLSFSLSLSDSLAVSFFLLLRNRGTGRVFAIRRTIGLWNASDLNFVPRLDLIKGYDAIVRRMLESFFVCAPLCRMARLLQWIFGFSLGWSCRRWYG